MRSTLYAKLAAEGKLERKVHNVNVEGLPSAEVFWVGPGYVFELASDYSAIFDEWLFSIPAGFIFNAASVPRIAWSAISPLDLGTHSVLLHDFTYAGRPVEGMSRKESDVIFRKVMKLEGVSWWKRNIAYYAVRAFGGGRWSDAQ